MSLEERILKLFQKPSIGPLKEPEIANRLHVRQVQQAELHEALESLERSGRIARIRHNRFTLPIEADLIPGRIMISRSGSGTLVPEDPKLPRVHVPAENSSTAMHHDLVLVRLQVRSPTPRNVEPEPAGKVIRILERARTQIVGTLHRSSQFFYVIPDDPRIPHDIYVTLDKKRKKQPRVGEKVVVELLEWESRHTNPEGKIVENLGSPDKLGVDIESILRQYSLPASFPHDVAQECKQFGTTVPKEDVQGRKDCRHLPIVTVDPDDAKDFDDAICVRPASKGRWRLWVHIADVSHYVKPGTVTDQEAQRRGNSTYLVDRVIPMLPEALSNELCSLKPEVERLTKCVEFLLDDQARVIKQEFYSSIIRSRRRFTYKEALAILEQPPAEPDPFQKVLLDAHGIAQKLRKTRFSQGALDLDFPETKIRLDDQGRVARVELMENDISHQLIEEFMLLANEAVAETLKKRRRSTVYRIHEDPDQEKLDELAEELAIQGISVGNLTQRREVQKFLERTREHPAGQALRISFLRSLKRARYAVDPLGHYGLAKENYTHFTSPIRRYADLVVHRSLFEKKKLNRQKLKETADHISFTERNSSDAEQDSKRIKLLTFLDRQLRSGKPEVYSGAVTEIRNFGFFVEVEELGISGLVRLSYLEDDFYVFDRKNGLLRGQRRKRVIRLGEKVPVTVYEVDPVKKQVNFTLAKPPSSSQKTAKRRRSRSRRNRKRNRKSKGPAV